MNDIDYLVKISKFAGARFDLVQAGGGNSSVKLASGEMLIKASGFSLSEVEQNSGYSRVKNAAVVEILENKAVLNASSKKNREDTAKKLFEQTVLDTNRPSIETFLHSILHKFTLHTHPVTVNAVTCSKNWKKRLEKLFPGCLSVPYETPGIELAVLLNLEVQKYMKTFHQKPAVIFLQNHGLIVSSDNADEVLNLTDTVNDRLSEITGIRIEAYKNANKIAGLINPAGSFELIAYYSTDAVLNEMLNKGRQHFTEFPFCPDKLVYCGISAAEINSLSDHTSISRYKEQFHDIPKVILYKDSIYLAARNIRKAKEIEDVLKFHILSLSSAEKEISYLTDEEIAYLSNWESEKYRQKL